MVSEEEIDRVARLMRIEITDHTHHTKRVQKMLSYFDILDSAGVEDEEITSPILPIGQLRQDVHHVYPQRLIDGLHNYKGTYVRAPKMV